VGRLSIVVAGLGVAVLAGAWMWFESFYTKAGGLIGYRGPLPNQCLYSTDGICGVAYSAGAMAGAHPYQPWPFWLGVGLLVLAALIDLPIWPVRTESRGSGLYIPPDRIEPVLPGPETVPESYQADAFPEGWRVTGRDRV